MRKKIILILSFILSALSYAGQEIGNGALTSKSAPRKDDVKKERPELEPIMTEENRVHILKPYTHGKDPFSLDKKIKKQRHIL